MKKPIFLLFAAFAMTFSSCETLNKIASGIVTEQDAIDAVRQALMIGSNYGSSLLGQKGAFGKETLMAAIFPPELQKVASTLQQLGLSKEVDRFTNTLGTCAEKTAAQSAPVFIQGIKQMNIRDAIGIIKNGGNAATDYLRRTIGDTLRKAIAPNMQLALDEYKIAKQWNDLVKPAKAFLGDKVNLDISNLMAGLVANMMFNKIEEKEREIRTSVQARETPLLQKVFGYDWSRNTGGIK
jgi:Protein of unknown function (DUF4197)